MQEIIPRERMKVTSGLTYKEILGDECGSIYVTINSDKDGICEVFTIKGKSGGCLNTLLEAIGRLASLALSAGIPPKYIINQLKGIRCPHGKPTPNGNLLSCPDVIAKILERYVNREHTDVVGNKPVKKNEIKDFLSQLLQENPLSVVKIGESPECPQCGGMVQMEGRCLTCRICGWSKCP